MTGKKFILVGPNPFGDRSQHPGGQLTAAIGIAMYAREHGYRLDIVDTLITNFPPPSFLEKLRLGIKRVFIFTKKLVVDEFDGVILFVGARHSFFERVVLSLLARVCGIKTLFCIRDGAFLDWVQSSALQNRLVRMFLRIPNQIVVQGQRFEKALATSGLKNKLKIVRNWLPDGVEITTKPKFMEKDAPLKLVFVGWLVKEKGIWELLEAYNTLQSKYNVTLDYVGGGTLESELRERVSNLNLNGVHIHGWMPPETIKNILDDAHVFVLPTYFEGFPNALLEAMARGLPAVCSDVGMIPDSIQDGVNGFLVPPKNPRLLSEAIERYLNNTQLIVEHSTATVEVTKNMHDRATNLAMLFSSFG